MPIELAEAALIVLPMLMGHGIIYVKMARVEERVRLQETTYALMLNHLIEKDKKPGGRA